MLTVTANMRKYFKRLRKNSVMTGTMAPALVFLAVVCGSTAAFSEVRGAGDEKLSIKTRTNEAYDPVGIRLGDFTLSPSITNSLRYTDNVYATDIDKVHDFIYEVKPSVSIKSDFVRHEVSAGFSIERGLYRDISSENYTDYTANIGARFDITGDTSVPFKFSYGKDHYRRGSPDNTDSAKPTVFDLVQASTGIVHRGQTLAMKAIADIKRYVFDDDVTDTQYIDNSDRDRDEMSLYTSIGMAEEAYIAPFAYSNLKSISYDKDFDRNGIDRDSGEYELGIGTLVNFSDITKASFNMGYIHRSLSDDRFEDIGDLAYGVNLSWEPSPLVMFLLEGNRTLRETIDTLSPASVATDLRLTMDYELFPNVFLYPTLGYTEQDYEEIDRIVTSYDAGLSGTYKINQNFWLSLNYKYITQDDEGDDTDGAKTYDSNTYGLSLKMQF